MSTTVINLFGGSGCGKSTTAALLFARMKLMGLHVELVREYVKYWAWNDRKVREWDQLYLLGKQSAYESMLYGKVDYIVTDSPILLAGIYQEFRSSGKDKYVGDAAKAFLNHAKQNNVIYRNFFLNRDKPFDPRGRWETEDEAKEIDKFILHYLESFEEAPPFMISGPNDERDLEILSVLNHLNSK
jgi:ABC-type oligopeptide transport system ATPase subunit